MSANSVDYWQQRGYLGSPDEWREACRLFRVRCSPEDVQRMGKLRAYVEDGLLIVSRPDSNTPTPAWHDAPELAALKAERDELLAVLKKVAAWNKAYPSSRIYGYEAIKKIAAEMDAINAEAVGAIAKAEGAA